MSLSDICCGLASGLGKFVGVSYSVLVRAGKAPRNALRKSVGKLRPMSARERIRSIIAEELAHLMGKQAELTSAELQERLQVMTEAIESLREEIAELSAHGPVSGADVFKAMRSLRATYSLTSDESAILASVFRQNIAIQRPEMVGTTVD